MGICFSDNECGYGYNWCYNFNVIVDVRFILFIYDVLFMLENVVIFVILLKCI